MSKISIFSLGGLQENGKNLYCVDVDNHLFVLDCGLIYPTSELYGIDNIIPDITYLVENKDRIEGVYLTHGHDDHIGAIQTILQKLPDVKVYGSRFTIALCKDILKDHNELIKKDTFTEINSKTVLDYDVCKIRFYVTAHNIPDSYGIIVDTPDGNIIYTGNYTFDQNQHQANFTSMYDSLVKCAKKGVLALMTESLGALNEGNRGTILEFRQRIETLFAKASGRMIFSLFSSDLQRIQMIINIALSFNKRVAILGRKTQRIVNLGIELGYLVIPLDKLANLKFIDDLHKNNEPDLVVLVTGERHEPYFMLQRMARHQDRLIHLEENDFVVLLTNPYPGTEKMAARTLDIIYRVTSKVISFSGNLLPESHASREEIKSMINLLHPKYIIPVIGEYRHQYACIQIANCVGFNVRDNLIIPDNGDILDFLDGKYLGIHGSAPIGEVMIDGQAVGDLGQVVMRDRELLAEDGVLLICANINPRTKKVLNEVQIVSKGFSTINEIPEMKDNIISIFNKNCEKHFVNKFINWSDFKSDIKDDVSRMIYKTSKSNPIIIPVLISTDPDLIMKDLAKKSVKKQTPKVVSDAIKDMKKTKTKKVVKKESV